MENNKKNFWKGALAGALAMFMVGAAALGIMNVAGVSASMISSFPSVPFEPPDYP